MVENVNYKTHCCYFCSFRGNIVGQKPYTSGTPCSKCPTKYPKCDDKLCSETTCEYCIVPVCFNLV